MTNSYVKVLDRYSGSESLGRIHALEYSLFEHISQNSAVNDRAQTESEGCRSWCIIASIGFWTFVHRLEF
jgi:hypothetical protein